MQDPFKDLIGNEPIKEYLKAAADKGSVQNSWIFSGPSGIGKTLFAKNFAHYLLTKDDLTGNEQKKIESHNHPDIRIYRPEGKIALHSIASMRQFSEDVYLALGDGRWRIFIISDAEKMLATSANALLKTFEEPAKDAVIILVTSALDMLLPTVRSRCRIVHFHSIEEESITSFISKTYGKTHEEAKGIAALANGSIGQAVSLAQKGDHPLRKMLLEILARQGFSSYKELTDASSFIAEAIETDKREVEESLRESLNEGFQDHMTAWQREAFEKEVEGALALHMITQVSSLFEIILTWYRDLFLMRMHGSRSLLTHRDMIKAYETVQESKISLDEVQKTLSFAKLSLERSTSLPIVFEGIFLKLNFY